jgi:hypothetical protein
MGDRTYAHMDIALTPEQCAELCQLIDNPEAKTLDGVTLGIHNAFNQLNPDETDVLPYDPNGMTPPNVFRFIVYESNYGDNGFRASGWSDDEIDLPKFCQLHKLPYSIYWGQGGEYRPGFVWYHPEFGQEVERGTDGQGITLSAYEMKTILDAFPLEDGSCSLRKALEAAMQEPGFSPDKLPECGAETYMKVYRVLAGIKIGV